MPSPTSPAVLAAASISSTAVLQALRLARATERVQRARASTIADDAHQAAARRGLHIHGSGRRRDVSRGGLVIAQRLNAQGVWTLLKALAGGIPTGAAVALAEGM